MKATSKTEPEGRVMSDSFQRGLATRREVLGEHYVQSSLDRADEFDWPMQVLTTEYCWDGIWNRPGLGRAQRSIVNLSLLVALNRPHELKIHVRGALNNGLTKTEIQEVLLQTAIYCGVPAAMDAFRVVASVFAEAEPETGCGG